MLTLKSVTLSSAATRLFAIESSGHEIEVDADAYLSVFLPANGAVAVDGKRSSTSVTGGEALTLRPSARRTRVGTSSRNPFQAYVFKMPWTAAGTVSENWAFFSKGNPGTEVIRHPLSSPATRSLRTFIEYVFGDMLSEHPILTSPMALRSVEALMLEHLNELFSIEDSLQGLPSNGELQLCKRAEDYMDAHHAEPLTTSMIARSMGVPPTVLSKAFRNSLGKTVRQRLTDLRLEHARAQLLSGMHETVTSSAFSVGLVHLGRFTQAYRAAFRELPSVTLARSRK